VVSIWCPVCRVPGRLSGILETIENPAILLHIRGLQGKSRCIYNLRKAARKNSAYRSGCHKFLFSITYRTPNPVVTQLNGFRHRLGLRLLENRLAHEPEERANHTLLQAKLPERCTETLDRSLGGRTMLPSRSLTPCGKPANSAICTPPLDTPTARKTDNPPKRRCVWTAFSLRPRTHRDVRKV
jgi:hypothetical protein